MASIKIALVVLLFISASTVMATAQTQVFVPGNASGDFGSPVDQVNQLVPAITVNGPGTITVTYVSGTVDIGGVEVDPEGITQHNCPQTPLQEAQGVAGGRCNHVGGLLGAFVSQGKVDYPGFSPVDGSKNAATVGVMPGLLFFIGESKTLAVNQAGTLFLGINDEHVGDNSGGFNVEVTVQ